MKKALLSSAIGLLVGLAFTACDEEEPSDPGTKADCEAIIDACHTKDDGSDEMINQFCHQPAHDAVDGVEGASFATCTERRTECVEACDAAPEVMHMDSDHGDHDHDHDHDGDGG